MAKQKKLAGCHSLSPLVGEHLFKIIAFDWVRTAVESPLDEAVAVRTIIEDLLKRNVLIVIVTDLDFSDIDHNVCWPIQGLHKQNLFVCANKGSEVFGFDARSHPILFYRKETTGKQNRLLSHVADELKRNIADRFPIAVEIIRDHVNRCKIDLFPEHEDTSRLDTRSLKKAVEQRLLQAGFDEGIKGAMDRLTHNAQRLNLADARVTTDIRHIEISLTDESDSMQWITNHLAKQRNIPFEDILIVGSEFGQRAGFEGKNHRMVLPEAPRIHYVSVGEEPDGVPEDIIHLGGGPSCFAKLMRVQLQLNKKLSLTTDPVFLVSEHGFNALREREVESILTVGNGYLGIRGSLEEERYGSAPSTLLAGVYYQKEHDFAEHAVIVPNWLFTNIYVERSRLFLERGEMISHKRTLDLKKGLLCREWRQKDEQGRVTFVRFLRFASHHDPHALIQRITVIPENYTGEIRVKTGARITDSSRRSVENISRKAYPENKGLSMITKTKGTRVTIAQAQTSVASRGFIEPEYMTESQRTWMVEEWTWHAEMGQRVDIDKFVSIYTNRDAADAVKRVEEHVHELADKGFEGLLLEHIESWDKCWAPAFIEIEPDHQAQRWMNFATYHLLIAGNPDDENASISARALTGTVYEGHIFWDAELFILPFFCFTHPAAARSMLMYRYHRLPAARRRAEQAGYKGALYAWESALSGDEMTPPFALAPNGRLIPIGSGMFEHHISAAIAHGAWLYWAATMDTSFLLDAGAEIILETARFWASRVTKRDGKYHIDNVEGPDEYHEDVNDNFYTNIMAAWNLEQANKLLSYIKQFYPERFRSLKKELALNEAEPQQWAHIAAKMYTYVENGEDLIEQFAGYFQLEDTNVDEFEPRTAPLDVILGREKTQKSQVVKQADVIMALYLLEERLDPQMVRRNFEHYDTRTGHGSSLSPSMYGLVAARIGLDKRAWHYFKKTALIDLAGNMSNAAGGVHIAALGGLWQQVVMGFAGVRIGEDGLFVNPDVPSSFGHFSFSLKWRDLQLHFDVEAKKKIELKVKGKGELSIGIFGKPFQQLEAGKTYIANWDDNQWLGFEE